MASFLLQRPDLFPDGTVVKAYPTANWPDPGAATGAPKGASAAEGTVASGKVTLEGLAEEVPYFAVAEVGGSYRYVAIRVGKPGGSPTRAEVEKLESEIAPVDIDPTLAANSDLKVPSQKAVNTLVVTRDMLAFHRMASRPTGTKYESVPRVLGELKNSGALTSGTMMAALIPLEGGDTVKEFAFHSATTAAAEPTHQWVALLDSTRKVLAVTADKTNTAWGANSRQVFSFAANYTVPATGLYYVGLLVKATTVPTIQAKESINSFPLNSAPILAGNSTAALEGPEGLAVGATAATLTGTPRIPYFTIA